MTLVGKVAGCVGDARWARFQATQAEIARVTELLQSFVRSPQVGLTNYQEACAVLTPIFQGWQSHGFDRKPDGAMKRYIPRPSFVYDNI